jgi:hypothetical protein
MKHFIGGFGAGLVLGVILDVALQLVAKRNTQNGMAEFISLGFFCGLAAWGLLP